MHMTKSEDNALARLAAGGDRAAFSALLERHYDFIHRVAYRGCGNAEDAQDITQDVCVKLGTAIASFRGDAALTSWLYRITLNAVRDRQRQQARAARGAVAISHAVQDRHEPEPEHRLSLQQLWRAVHKLPDRQRDAVLLVFGEELSHAQAGEIMGCKEPTVSWHVREARKKLKLEFEGTLP